MDHFDFVRGVRNGTVNVDIDPRQSRMLYDSRYLMPERGRQRQARLRKAMLALAPVMVVLCLVVEPIYAIAAAAPAALLIYHRAERDAVRGVLKMAIADANFYHNAQERGILTVRTESGA